MSELMRFGIFDHMEFREGSLQQLYEERLDVSGTGDKVYASLVLGDGKLYAVSRTDGAIVLSAGRQFQQLAHNDLGDASVFNATPVISNGQLLIRSDRPPDLRSRE